MRLEGPALSAWRKLRPRSSVSQPLELLTDDLEDRPVYRLVSDGGGDRAIIAKRCRNDLALVERILYEEILPNLHFPSLRYYGSIEEPNGEFSWLFLEDVSAEEEYDPGNQEHRIAAAGWLGEMNTAAAGLVAAACLPGRGPTHYLDLLRSARRTMISSVANPALEADDLALLDTILGHCEDLSARWSQLTTVCTGVPHTLVHGDFISKNVKVRNSREGLVLLPYDWEKAGWGIPAEDISRVDIPTYWRTVQIHWPQLTIRALERLASLGKIFRCIVYLDWIAPGLTHGPVKQPLQDLRRCESWLAKLIQTADW